MVVRLKGTLLMLREWLEKVFKPCDPTPMSEMCETFKDIRRQRQSPAHAVQEDKFDQEYFHKQRDMLTRGYSAMRRLRLILANDPAVQANPPEMSQHLRDGKIWTY